MIRQALHARLKPGKAAEYKRLHDEVVFLDVTNLTDEPARTDITLNGLHFFKTNQGVLFSAGVRGRF